MARGIGVVEVVKGGLPVTLSTRGLAMEAATRGLAVTVVLSGGLPIVDVGSGTPIGSGIRLSNSTFTAGNAQGTAIGTLSVVGGTGTYTFTLTDSASNKVQVAGANGVNLQVGSAVSTVGSYSITVHATNGVASIFDQVFLITVLAVPPSGGTPSISGSTVVLSTLTAATGTWAGTAPITYAYQWKRAGSNVGTNSSTYATVEADIGSTITVTVTATNAGGSANATSAATAAITGIAPVNSVAPVIAGTAADGSTLSVTNNGTWSGTPAPTYSYQWKRGGVTNIGTGSSSYTIVTADVGSTIRCDVTGANVAGNATAQSNSTATVTGGAPAGAPPTYLVYFF